jgi:hypothetical protein
MPRHGRSSRLDLGYDEGLSVDMSRILRHKGVNKGVPVGEDGFARFSDLAWALNRNSDDIWLVVYNSRSKRDGQRFFTLNHAAHVLLIRATAKHSLECVNRNLVRSGAASTTGPPPSGGHRSFQVGSSRDDSTTPNQRHVQTRPSSQSSTVAQAQRSFSTWI